MSALVNKLRNLLVWQQEYEAKDAINKKREAEARAEFESTVAYYKYTNLKKKHSKTVKKAEKLKKIFSSTLIYVVLIALVVALLAVVGAIVYHVCINVLPAGLISDDVWTKEQYGVLYTLGFLLFFLVCGSVFYVYMNLDKDGKGQYKVVSTVFIIASIIVWGISIMYTIKNGKGSNWLIGVCMPLLVAFLLVSAPFNCGGLGNTFLDLIPTGLIVLGFIIIFTIAVFQLDKLVAKLKSKKFGARDFYVERIIRLKKKKESAYEIYKEVEEQIMGKVVLINTQKEWSHVNSIATELNLSSMHVNSNQIYKILWCIENNYANSITEAVNWIRNDENRRRAEEETRRYRQEIEKELKDIRDTIASQTQTIEVTVKNDINIHY